MRVCEKCVCVVYVCEDVLEVCLCVQITRTCSVCFTFCVSVCLCLSVSLTLSVSLPPYLYLSHDLLQFILI